MGKEGRSFVTERPGDPFGIMLSQGKNPNRYACVGQVTAICHPLHETTITVRQLVAFLCIDIVDSTCWTFCATQIDTPTPSPRRCTGVVCQPGTSSKGHTPSHNRLPSPRRTNPRNRQPQTIRDRRRSPTRPIRDRREGAPTRSGTGSGTREAYHIIQVLIICQSPRNDAFHSR